MTTGCRYRRVVSSIVNCIAALLGAGQSFSSQQVQERTGASRQAVHKHLRRLMAVGVVRSRGRARATRYEAAEVEAPVAPPLRQRVEVASAGSRYRLSARLLMLEVTAGEVQVDFSGVSELGEEFLDELFFVWAPKHPEVRLRVVHLPSRLAAGFFAFAKRSASHPSRADVAR